MSIDIERLKVDADYWDEVAPEGATHYDNDANVFCCKTGYWTRTRTFKFLKEGHNQWGSGRYIPRPEPAADWNGEGLPPVGCECEVRYAEYWVQAKAVHLTASGVLICEKSDGGVYHSISPEKFRPLKSQHERLREELIAEADEVLSRAIEDDQPMAQALYDAGLLRREAKP